MRRCIAPKKIICFLVRLREYVILYILYIGTPTFARKKKQNYKNVCWSDESGSDPPDRGGGGVPHLKVSPRVTLTDRSTCVSFDVFY